MAELGGPDLSSEERAALPQDTVLRRLLEDRRVRIAAIAGIPLIVALCAAAAIFAQSFGLARSVRIDGPRGLVPGAPSSVRIGYAEMDDYGLPHPVRIDRARLEVCSAAPASPSSGCTPLGTFPGARRPGDVTLHLQVPDVPDGTWPVRAEITAGGRTRVYRFPVRFGRDATTTPLHREDGGSPPVPLGASGVVVDLVPFDGGIVRGWTSALILRAVGPDGAPYTGSLYLLPIGELDRATIPPSIQPDAAGLASFALRSETFEYRLAFSTAPFPAMDPLEVETGLLSEEALARAALVEVSFRPMVGPLRVAASPTETRDRPFLRAGDPLFAFLDRPAEPPTALLSEVWQQGRLLRLGDGASPGGPLEFGDFRLPPGLLFVQVHRPGEPVDSVVGRTVWAGTAEGQSPEEPGALLDAFDWPDDDGPWVAAVRTRLADLDGTARELLGRYVLGRHDAQWYPPGTLFESGPADRARVAVLRESVKSAMAWGIGALAAALAGLAVFVSLSSWRDARRRRVLEAEARGTQGMLLRVVVLLLIVAAGLAGLALLFWGMKQTYLAP